MTTIENKLSRIETLITSIFEALENGSYNPHVDTLGYWTDIRDIIEEDSANNE